MNPDSTSLTRRIGMVLFLAFMLLIVVGVLIREPWAANWRVWFSRWPFWVLGSIAIPLILMRLLLWRRRRSMAEPGTASTRDASEQTVNPNP